MTLLLDMINGIHKFLGYLDISPKYLNRAYTILSIIPTAYILRIIYGLFSNQNYVQATLYSIGFLILVYFWVLNIVYYFLDKNMKGDVTQVFVKVLPDEVFNIESEGIQTTQIDHLQTEKVQIDFEEDYQLILADYLQTLISRDELRLQPLKNGFTIPKNTLYPYYFIKKRTNDRYTLQIGTSYGEMTPIGTIQWQEENTLTPVGLFITGGDFVKNNVKYHEPYSLKLYIKKAASQEESVTSRQVYRRQKTK
ncbi:hypothetical protein A5886_003083 [Enterococcus sp. 8G7_MSG3316]|uniref:Uncharacterized protein n=1 Tax=Candidatus Enterococcus testudinis TaxID=1834191 RepID=A0A242AAL0_9ENTE|nr:DUF6681 family protein [Enterococcus sp. 8G7_MSG3316]OTN77982.1 hypothetical protein A5886_003083 [Enterococcus sp. 8G7_MSG3316]